MYPLIHPLSAHIQVADPWAQSGLPRSLTEETWAHPHAQPGTRYPVSQSPVSLPHYDSAALPQGPGAAAHHHFLSVFTVGPRPSSPPHHRPPTPSPDSGDCPRIAFSNSSSHSRLRVACPFLNRLTTALSCRGQHSLAFFFPASTYKADRRHQPPITSTCFFRICLLDFSTRLRPPRLDLDRDTRTRHHRDSTTIKPTRLDLDPRIDEPRRGTTATSKTPARATP